MSSQVEKQGHNLQPEGTPPEKNVQLKKLKVSAKEQIKTRQAEQQYKPERDMRMAQGGIEKPHPMIGERATVLEQQAKTLTAFKNAMQLEMKNRAA